jgi:hypothetical protein
MSKLAPVQNIWLYHINPKSNWEYGWDVFQPSSLLRSRDKIWPAGNKSKRVAAGDLVCVYMKNIAPNRDGIYVVGRVCEVMIEDQKFRWRVDRSLSAYTLERPMLKTTVRHFFPRSYGPFMQALPATSHMKFLNLIGIDTTAKGLSHDGSSSGGMESEGAANEFARPGVKYRSNPKDRVEVEQAAVAATTAHFARQGYSIDSVQKDNVGWDLRATRGKHDLRLEVKGLSGSEICIELTPNEYAQMLKWRHSYHVCVVTDALINPELTIFKYCSDSHQWIDDQMRRLRIAEIVGARCTIQP